MKKIVKAPWRNLLNTSWKISNEIPGGFVDGNFDGVS